ncbi:MAG: PD-(D/E)XK nuclease family protein [Rikenellaceae bacterium]|jgi:hypothetical protein|uniref:PD-(D/E)XK nuclease family protein n=1 Tax=Tenuifilum sp. TaxID=2760880 RepID=UPI001699B758|nr:PD-(D/E)XK nuclease family protein [Rikenellaceae bacterium]HNV62446.1 PD-(D/E)XK nuclease family protein [Candidatus Cloacimonas acidaminovorans]HQG72764.1 PD-(D/E)XK nuclease family protein [Tenuifilum sp.]
MLNITNIKLVNEPYRHYSDGSKEYKGITKYLNDILFPNLYANVPEHVLNKAAERGSDFHHFTQVYDLFGTCENKEVEWYAEAMKGIKVVAMEYIVTDFEFFASPIDRVIKANGKIYLADIKTTSNLQTDYLRWQLSIYQHLFKIVNPDIEVAGLMAIWLNRKKERVELFEVDPVPERYVIDFLNAARNGTEFSNPFTIAKSDNDEIALNLIKEHANILSKIEEYKELEKEYKQRIEAMFTDLGVDKWDTNYFTITKAADYTRETLDSKALKEVHPEIYKQFIKVSNVNGSVKISLK